MKLFDGAFGLQREHVVFGRCPMRPPPTSSPMRGSRGSGAGELEAGRPRSSRNGVRSDPEL